MEDMLAPSEADAAAIPYPVPSPPDELLCPITQMLMRDPVILSSGHAVELEALGQFWQTCPFALANPVTREKLRSSEDVAIVPALQLRSSIDAYLGRLAPNAIPDGWPAKDPGPRSTREELRALSLRVHRIASARIGGLEPERRRNRSELLGSPASITLLGNPSPLPSTTWHLAMLASRVRLRLHQQH